MKSETHSPGATVVITHRVSKGEQAGYEQWLTEIGPISSFVVSGMMVFLMVYLIMPRYTKLIRKWLFG